jgi:hypothetical protein
MVEFDYAAQSITKGIIKVESGGCSVSFLVVVWGGERGGLIMEITALMPVTGCLT